MKKNKMMRSASALLVMTLLTTSVISGTFAKYTTAASAADTARVAKWGVSVEASGLLFSESYDEVAKGNKAHVKENTITVESVNAANATDSVVAPGTNGGDGLTFKITGTPEVAVKIEVAVTDTKDSTNAAKDIFLAKGNYADLTTGTSVTAAGGVDTNTDTKDYFAVSEDYHPIKYTLTQTKGTTETTLVDKGTLAAVETALEGLTTTVNIKPNQDLSTEFGTFKLTWEWDFDANGAGTSDKADTLLGDLATDSTIAAKGNGEFEALTVDTDYSLSTQVAISVKVTQVD